MLICYNNSVEGRGHFYLPVKQPLLVECPRPSTRLRQTTDSGFLIRGHVFKRCNRCKKLKLKSNFYKDKAQKDGVAGSCKVCSGEKKREWCAQNRERESEHSRK